MTDNGRLDRRLSLRSLVSRLLLAAAPVALVVSLLLAWVAAPLLRAPGDLAQAKADLVEVQRYQTLLTLINDQNLHWSEYQYLPSRELGPIREEMRASQAAVGALKQRWTNPSASAKAAFKAYDQAARLARTSQAGVDAGRTDVALRVLTGQVLALTNHLARTVEGVLLTLSTRSNYLKRVGSGLEASP